ncbi:MAG: class I SAM-dependent methyltransferase [Candidatus Absconditabacterales bacterium]|nr:class I SAM-dependent methyltransferase [Candidatus Absconditabacterales bacterium]
MSSSNIYTIISDNEKDMGILDGLKKRFIDQKFCYVDKAADLYYSGIGKHDTLVKEEKNKIVADALDYMHLVTKNLKKDKKAAFISLGCGNGNPEKKTIVNLLEQGYDISYFGIDYSREMLDLAVQNYQNISCKKHFICADVGSQEFQSTILSLTDDYDIRIYAFLGFTFIALDQSYFIDSMYSLMKKGDFFLFDILIRKDDTKKTLISFFERYNNYLKNDDFVKFHEMPILYAGMDPQSGSFGFDYFQEKGTGAYIYRCFFQFNQKIIITFKGQRIIFLPGEKITMIHRRNYNREQFEYFIAEHEFRYVDHIDHKVQDYVTNSCYLYAK